jgi:hypothetical protein
MRWRGKIKFEKAPPRRIGGSPEPQAELADTLFRDGELPSRFSGSALRGLSERQNPAMSTPEFLDQVLPYTPLPAPLAITQIYETLAALLVPYARRMESEMHPKIGFCLKERSKRTGRETHFGAVQVLQDGVAYHLFALYSHPTLVANASPELACRLRGPTSFHFASIHAALVAELAALTHACYEQFVADGVV